MRALRKYFLIRFQEKSMNFWFDDDKMHDECGVFGVFALEREVARLAFFALYALQHRGQESAGIVTSDGRLAYQHKGMGLVAQVFDEENLRPLLGHLAIGQTRYSTTGSSNLRNAQPYLIETIYGPLGIAHNGNLTNAEALRQQLLERGVGLSSTSDSEVITQMLAAPPEVWGESEPTDDRWIARIRAFMQVAEGAYSLTLLTHDAIYAVRDPLGLRPLCLGQLNNGSSDSYVVASETCALGTIGAEQLRDIEPGEIVRLDADGLTTFSGVQSNKHTLCIFEHVYFARPDSTLNGQTTHQVRQQLGRQLARETAVAADAVVGVPDSATPHAIGYSLESGIPYTEGLTKNRYIGRTFIQPDDRLRKEGVRIKYNPLTANLQGKRIVLVDDSIVRGNTAGPLVQLLRDAGATEVHVRVASPPIRHPCFMGVDMVTYSELIAYQLNVAEICDRIGADSLGYLSLEGLETAVNWKNAQPQSHCTACFSGQYPIPIPEWLFEENREKLVFEKALG
ncbi:MAG: amidophosphoribosyltransferase [Chloroflexi bacterium]|nr:amidophosphoribosyltransferase [Chloroflexota bacterium]